MVAEGSARATKTWVLALTSLASFMVALDSTVVATALTTIRRDLGASLGALEWTVNAYNLSFAVLLMTGSALGDRFGRRRMFVLGIALFAAASAACGLSVSAGALIAARAAQGAGAALIAPLALALLSEAFPREERAKAMGVFSGVAGIAVLSGPVIGGSIAEGMAWQWIFWINVPIGAIAIALVLARVKESFGPPVAVDAPGLVLVTCAALGVVWGLVRGNEVGWGSAEVVVTLAGGLALLAAFIAWEQRAAHPMVPMRLFRSRAFSAGNASCFLFAASMFGTLFFIAQFLQTAQGYGPRTAGLLLLPWTATLFVVAPIAGARINRLGERRVIVVGLLLQALGMAWIALFAAPDVAYAKLVAPFIIAGAGVSMAMPATQSAVMNSVAPTEIGKASGTYYMLRFLGAVFGIAILVAVFAASGDVRSPAAFSSGFARAVGVSAFLSLIGAIAGFWQPAHGRASSLAIASHPSTSSG